jgi:hypothetical protein
MSAPPRQLPQPGFLHPVVTSTVPETKTKIRRNGNFTYTTRIGEKICERIMLQQTLNKICSDPRMPSKRTIVRWLADQRNTEFRESYYYARRVQAELYVDEIFEIADDVSGDYRIKYDKDGEPYVEANNEHIQRSRVRIDTRKWYAAKLVPRIYGDLQQIEHGVTGDLAELLKGASNKDSGLPPPIEEK